MLCVSVSAASPAHDSPRKMVMQTTCKDKDLFANIGFYAAFLFFLQLSGTLFHLWCMLRRVFAVQSGESSKLVNRK